MTGLQGGAGTRMVLNLLQLNADAEIKEMTPGNFATKGGFYAKKIMVGKPKDERPETEKLGETVNVVMLKVRRRLEQRSKSGEVVLRTSEHNVKTDVVELYDDKNKVIAIGPAASLREKFDGLKTIQVIYSLLLSDTGTKEPELVKLIVKGASLGSEARPEELPTFYQYISSFGKNAETGETEHLREYVSVLGLVKEEGAKTYFTMTFTRGEKLSPEVQEVANTNLRDVFGKLTEQDAATKSRIANGAKSAGNGEVVPDGEAPAAGADDSIVYPGGEDINPEDIPF